MNFLTWIARKFSKIAINSFNHYIFHNGIQSSSSFSLSPQILARRCHSGFINLSWTLETSQSVSRRSVQPSPDEIQTSDRQDLLVRYDTWRFNSKDKFKNNQLNSPFSLDLISWLDSIDSNRKKIPFTTECSDPWCAIISSVINPWAFLFCLIFLFYFSM